MNRARTLLGRLQLRAGDVGQAILPAKQQEPAAATVAPATPPPKSATSDVNELVKALNALSPKKQITVCELWPGPAIMLDSGVTITARSKKERRRFIRPVDADLLAWFQGLGDGDVLYDVGANCGSLTLAAGAMHGEKITIVAIEPGYANFESLTRNLSQNNMLGFVIPLQVALLDRTGLEPINYYKSTAAGTSLHAVGEAVDHEDNAFTPVETQMVPAYTLDDLLAVLKLPPPTHVKIDVDGTEGPLLDGAARTLAGGSIEELFVEVVDHDREGTRLASITALLASHGYELEETFSHHPADTKSFVADHLFRRRGGAPGATG